MDILTVVVAKPLLQGADAGEDSLSSEDAPQAIDVDAALQTLPNVAANPTASTVVVKPLLQNGAAGEDSPSSAEAPQGIAKIQQNEIHSNLNGALIPHTDAMVAVVARPNPDHRTSDEDNDAAQISGNGSKDSSPSEGMSWPDPLEVRCEQQSQSLLISQSSAAQQLPEIAPLDQSTSSAQLSPLLSQKLLEIEGVIHSAESNLDTQSLNIDKSKSEFLTPQSSNTEGKSSQNNSLNSSIQKSKNIVSAKQ
ncbi:OLC1v1032066C1 [Oldenlandia corymbosa var. corymbosa]|uniref:OLC1v1032066C1 n=1 Tax=Oldenlandia corymbosa var. corymbosa TaxID=529605 RepID=A0AAV1CKR5_OLDCO|nr:OLC1v1032066C1 [Oldenlandia corymbosa var. corymbosa]